MNSDRKKKEEEEDDDEFNQTHNRLINQGCDVMY
jgi:hypothetical protein